MQYTEVTVELAPDTELSREILTAVLADAGYDSFNSEAKVFKAYIPTVHYDPATLQTALDSFPLEGVKFHYDAQEMEDKDWNEEWEKNYFHPVIIDNRCAVHSSFHTDLPKTEYSILINPKMAFGTGHHETTSLILQELLDADLTGKRVLDMGCGTSILAIMAAMRGAGEVVAIDIDDWCVDNSRENLALNQIGNVEVYKGDATLLASLSSFDTVIANINRNILLQDMAAYAKVLKPGGHIWISGFYTQDIPVLRQKAAENGLHYVSQREKNHWATVHFEKK